MRMKIYFDLVSKPKSYQKLLNNQIHAFILSRMSNHFAKNQHEKGRTTLFTFGSVRIQHEEGRGSFMFSAPDHIAQKFIVGMRTNELFRIGNYHCQLTDIREINDIVTESGELLLRGRVLLSSGDRKRTIREKSEVEKYLADIGNRKLRELDGVDNLSFDVHKVTDTSIYYAYNNGQPIYLPAADIITTVTGTPQSLKLLLDFGAGQNTGAGAGMLWEV